VWSSSSVASCDASLEVELDLQDLLLLLPVQWGHVFSKILKYDLLDLLLECFKLVNVVLLLGRVVLKAVLRQLPDLHAVVLSERKKEFD
jgi:hypothetical protein